VSRLPVLFTAHGNPMNALGTTPFAARLGEWGASWPRPSAILSVSAHREESPLSLTASERPPTVHDFHGFTRALYELRFPAPGAPAAAGRAASLRDEGVLLLGSGNLVHNLSEADLGGVDLPVDPWAAELDDWVAARISAGDVDALASLSGAPDARRVHPTLERYAPVVVCAAAGSGGPASFPVTGFEHANLSLRCVRWG